MKRTLPIVFVAFLAASTVSAVAQEGVMAPSRPRFTQEVLRRAVSATVITSGRQGQPARQTDAAPATGPNRSWDTLVDTIKQGRRVTVTLMAGTSVEGKLLAIDTKSLSVEQSGEPHTIQAADVYRVRHARARKRHVRRGILLGMTAAAVAGAIAGHGSTTTIQEADGSTRQVSDTAEGAAIFAIFFGFPGGAIAGAAMPIGQPLYEAAVVAR